MYCSSVAVSFLRPFRLINASQLSANLRSNQARLRHILFESTPVHSTTKNVLEHVQSLRNVLCRSLAALEELHDDVDILLALDNDQKTRSDAFAKELGTSLGSTSSLRERIIMIEEALKLTPIACLTNGTSLTYACGCLLMIHFR